MAPALTEPVSHQSKISSPAQAASPRPIISEIVDQQLTTTASNRNDTSGQYLLSKSAVKTATVTQTTAAAAAVTNDSTTTAAPIVTATTTTATEELVESLLTTTAAASTTTTTTLVDDFTQSIEDAIVEELNNLTNEPTNGPLAATTSHMEHIGLSDFVVQPSQNQQLTQIQQSCDLITSASTSAAASTATTSSSAITQHQQQPLGDSQTDETDSERMAAIGQELLNFVNQGQGQEQLQLLERTLQESFDQVQQQQCQQPPSGQLALVPFQPQRTPNADAGSEKEVPQELVRELAQAACSQTLDLLGDPAADVSHSIDEVAASSQCSGTSSNNNMMTMKETAEMEQMLGELASSSEIDLLQVFKSFETAPTGENLCDLAGGLSLFNDVDVMNMGLDVDVVTSTSPIKECPTQEILAEIEKKRAKMIRDCDFMMRRLRKIQARQIGRHVSEEAYGIYEYAQNLIKRKERESKSISTMAPINQLHGDKHKSVSALKTMLKRIENVATTQQTSPGRMVNQTFVGSSSSLQSSTTASGVGADGRDANAINKQSGYPTTATIVPPFDPIGVQQLQQCSGLLATQLKMVNDAYDSDATASSSGGESADEGVHYNNIIQESRPM